MKFEDDKEKEYSNVLDIIEFECLNSNYGSQVLVFKNDEINVILRNQNKFNRNHNTEEKEHIKYKITIEKV